MKGLSVFSGVIDRMLFAFGYGFGALASLELFLTLHESSVTKLLEAIGAK